MEAAPAGGESGRRAHGPALGGEAGPVLLEAYSALGSRMNPLQRQLLKVEHTWLDDDSTVARVDKENLLLSRLFLMA